MKKFLIAACLLLVAVSAVRAQAQLVSGPISITGRIGNANLPLGAQLYDNAGTPKLSADFDNRLLKNLDGSATSVDWGGHSLRDGDGLDSADWGQRQLFAGNGSTITMDWNDPGLASFFSGNFVIRSNGNIEGGNASINLWDATNLAVIPSTRQLIANDGSTVALDWSDPTNVNFFGTAFITAAGAVSFVGDAAGVDSDGKFYGNGSNLTGVTPAVGSIGSVIAGTKTATGTATTTFTVTIGVTMANNTYKVTTEGDNALSAAVHYVNNKTTTTFDIVYLAGLTGAVAVDWIVSP